MSEKVNNHVYDQILLPKAAETFDINCEYFLAKLYMPILNAYFEMNSVLSKKVHVRSADSLDMMRKALDIFYVKNVEGHFQEFVDVFCSLDFFLEIEEERLMDIKKHIPKEALNVLASRKIKEQDLLYVRDSLTRSFSAFDPQIKEMLSIAELIEFNETLGVHDYQSFLFDLYEEYIRCSGELYHSLMRNIDNLYLDWRKIQMSCIEEEKEVFNKLKRQGLEAEKIMLVVYRLDVEDALRSINVFQYPNDSYTGFDLIDDFLSLWAQYLDSTTDKQKIA